MVNGRKQLRFLINLSLIIEKDNIIPSLSFINQQETGSELGE